MLSRLSPEKVDSQSILDNNYDPELDRWFRVQPMHAKRLGVGVAVVNRLLYAIGGFDGSERLASVERYHPENNAWSFVPPMTCGRSGAGVAAINHYIYVVGGFDGTRQLSSVERFDTEYQMWENVAPIKIARSALSLTSLDGKLYAIGGFDGTNFLSIVEVYDPKTNSWEEGTPLSSGRSGHASAVIYQPSCVDNFMDCLENESQKRDGNGSGPENNDSRFNRDLSGGSHSDSLLAENSTFVGFHTSFGSSGCRNCENEVVDISKENENNAHNTCKNLSVSMKDIPHRNYCNYWCKQIFKTKLIPCRSLNVCIDLQNLTNSVCVNNTMKINYTFSSLANRRKCTFLTLKPKSLIEIVRKCTLRNIVQEYRNLLIK